MHRLRSTVAWKLTVWFLLLSFLPIAVMVVFVRNTVADAFVEQTARDAGNQARVLASAASLLADDAAKRALLTAGSDDSHSAFLVGKDGRYLGAGQALVTDRSLAGEFPAEIARGMLSGQAGTAYDRAGGLVVGYAPVAGTDEIAVVVDDKLMVSASVLQMERTSLIQLAASLIIVSAIGGLAIWIVIGPIQRLTAAAERVGAGDLKVEIDTSEMEGELEILGETFNRMTSQLRESYDLLEQRVADRTRALAALNAISAVVSQSLDLEEVLEAAVGKTLELTGMDVGAAFRLGERPRKLRLMACQGLERAQAEELIQLEMRGSATWGAATGDALVVKEVADYPAGEVREVLESEGLKRVVGFPLIAKGRTVGAISLGTRSDRPVTAEDLAFLAAVGQQVGVAVDNARLYEHAEESAVAAERNRLARDLHDAVTQTLFSASLIAEVLPRIWQRNNAEGLRRLEELRQLTRGALAEMRTLLVELRPTALTEAPLANLLRQLADATTGRARVPVEFSATVEGALPSDVQIAFYRIAQEALSNVAKHSGASEAAMSLTREGRSVELRIGDDGRGFDSGKVTADHLGLGIMRERAQAVGAALSLESEAGRGTRVTVVWTEPVA